MSDQIIETNPETNQKTNSNSAKNLWKHAKRVTTFVLGFSVIVIGILMIVLPGPAMIVIPAGIAILATEFLWARRFLHKMKEKVNALTKNWQSF